jgi:hypothetical protein
MKRIASRLLGVLLFTALFARGADGLAHARRAQAMLGAEVWSQVIHVENTGQSRHYPRKVDALVFELAGILWFYSDADGTQSLSTYRGRLAQDKDDFSPLLREIDPGFTAWRRVPDDESATARALAERDSLLNGCFIESVAALRPHLSAGEPLIRAQLLSFYAARSGQVPGHTVLTYETGDKIRVIDPLEPDRMQTFPRTFAGNASALASALLGGRVAKAVWIPLDTFAASETARYAAATPVADRAHIHRVES